MSVYNCIYHCRRECTNTVCMTAVCIFYFIGPCTYTVWVFSCIYHCRRHCTVCIHVYFIISDPVLTHWVCITVYTTAWGTVLSVLTCVACAYNTALLTLLIRHCTCSVCVFITIAVYTTAWDTVLTQCVCIPLYETLSSHNVCVFHCMTHCPHTMCVYSTECGTVLTQCVCLAHYLYVLYR